MEIDPNRKLFTHHGLHLIIGKEMIAKHIAPPIYKLIGNKAESPISVKWTSESTESITSTSCDNLNNYQISKETDGIKLDAAKNTTVNSKSTPDNLKDQKSSDETYGNRILYKRIRMPVELHPDQKKKVPTTRKSDFLL